MGLFTSSNKNGPLPGGAVAIPQPKWKKTVQAGSRNRSRLKERRSLESYQRPENQLLARLPDETLHFLSVKNFFLVAAAAVVVVLGLLVVIRVSHSHNELGMDISRLTKRQVQLREENRRLKIELARLASLDDLEIVAQRDLGLVSPSQGQIVVVD
ncbi:MAG: septum formation initiator family protein [Deltaproteobacteria bacterium]|jgi:cell division protein FtsL|nr:septum formation initiator family protein [Deltaproteobacteria bacterium]